MQFPEGDTLGVVFSFLMTLQLLQKRMFIVCKEWKRVMYNLPHAWGDTLYLGSMHVPANWTTFAWNRITGLNMPRTTTNQGLLGLSVMPLKDLCLDHCRRITNIGLTYLSTLSITELYLKYTDITDVGLSHISSLPLVRLDLTGTHITDHGFSHIASMRLDTLYLSNCDVTNAGLAYISSLPLTRLASLGYVSSF